jgi:rubredoxin
VIVSESQWQKLEEKMQKYVCDACGYVYDPAENDNVKFEDLTEDWVCPVCGVGKDMFSPIN